MVTRGALVVAAVCGSAGASVERGDWFSAELTFDRDQIAIGESAVATLVLDGPFSGGHFGGHFTHFLADLIANDEYVAVSDVAAVAWNNPGLGFNGQGVAVGANVLGIEASQISLIPPIDNSVPLLVTTFTVTGIAAGELRYEAVPTQSHNSIFGWIDQFEIYNFDASDFVSRTLVVVPPPAGLLGMGLSFVLVKRRRR